MSKESSITDSFLKLPDINASLYRLQQFLVGSALEAKLYAETEMINKAGELATQNATFAKGIITSIAHEFFNNKNLCIYDIFVEGPAFSDAISLEQVDRWLRRFEQVDLNGFMKIYRESDLREFEFLTHKLERLTLESLMTRGDCESIKKRIKEFLKETDKLSKARELFGPELQDLNKDMQEDDSSQKCGLTLNKFINSINKKLFPIDTKAMHKVHGGNYIEADKVFTEFNYKSKKEIAPVWFPELKMTANYLDQIWEDIDRLYGYSCEFDYVAKKNSCMDEYRELTKINELPPGDSQTIAYLIPKAA